MSTGIGSGLTEIREAKGLSLVDLGLMLDVPSELIAAWELGLVTPHPYKLQQVYRLLDVTPEHVTEVKRKQPKVQLMKFSPERLVAIRKERGFSLERLGTLTGMDNVQIWKYEKGRMIPRPKSTEKIAKVLGVDPEEFYIPTTVEEQQ